MSAKVLIIDDDAFFRRIISDIISKADGFTVIGEANDGIEGLDKLDELQPDIVFLDIIMPLKNGIETAKEISKRANAPKIIMCSTMKSDSIIKDAENCGISAYIKKPPQEEEVLNILRSLV
ncbi:MAG: response regulator [Deltaproteobacteria bacterium]|nr:response regulator [Deltaproteobacteria bacterium]